MDATTLNSAYYVTYYLENTRIWITGKMKMAMKTTYALALSSHSLAMIYIGIPGLKKTYILMWPRVLSLMISSKGMIGVNFIIGISSLGIAPIT